MNRVKNFHESFVQLYLRDAEERGFLVGEAFFDKISNNLAEEGEINPDFMYANCQKKGIDVSGYSYDEERQTLTLINQSIFQNENTIETLLKSIIDTKFKNAENYIKECKKGFCKYLEETSDEYEMSYNIEQLLNQKKITKIRYFLLTDGQMTGSINNIDKKIVDEIEYEYRIVDIKYLHDIEMVNFEAQNFSVDVNLPCIKASTLESEYTSYLAVISGDKIAEIYDEFGSKLLEQNVRTFLQFKGKVNKGLRTTIIKNPEKFFAYNNGITATASSVDLDSYGHIKKIYDFQIVNGGQTTSSIYAAKKRDKLDLSNVNVQMKLSIVTDPNKQSEFVSKVAEYANTQNKVNKSDFFSNSPFHKEMKTLSKRVLSPTLNGSQKKTNWFYERVRGEYLNEQAYLTPAKKRVFGEINPKSQLIDKTLLAKAEMAWLQKPYIVSKGAQFCFLNFADTITNQLEKDEMSITENYFKEAISKIILFKHLEKKISKASWYNGGYRAQIVAYTISYLSYNLNKKGKYLNFDAIWDSQSIHDDFDEVLMNLASKLYKVLLKGTPGDANIGTWSKKINCWDKLKSQEIDIVYPIELLKTSETIKVEKRKAKKAKKMMNGIDAQIFAVKYIYWNEIYEYYSKYKGDFSITEKQFSILNRVRKGEFPSEAQSRILHSIYEMAMEDGVVEEFIVEMDESY